MPPRKWELIGQRFDKLVVFSEAMSGTKTRRWLCRCDCGNGVIISQTSLFKKAMSHSCGCSNTTRLRGAAKRSNLPEHRIWQAMVERCTNPNYKRWKDYGGRGIKVCDRWREFRNFIADVGPRPTPKHQIDRYPNNDGNYEPGNVRWATVKEQQNNRRSNRLITVNGQTKTAAEWALITGVPAKIIRQRINRDGLTTEQAVGK